MPYLYYKQKAYGGTSTVNDSEHVIANNGSGSEITSQQLFENILGDLATVEESTTASKAYEVGDYIILNSYFYKVTSAIALGGTITVGTNVVKTTVGDEFKTFEFPVRELTKAQYNALPTAQQNDGTIYLITDGDGGWEAENASYDNTESGLTATNVQDALDEINSYAPKYFRHVNSGYKHTTQNTWENTNFSVTVPTNHRYVVYAHQNYASGKPIGIGMEINNSTTLNYAPNYCVEGDEVHSMSCMLTPGTYYLYTKRAAAGSANNQYVIDVLDFYVG